MRRFLILIILTVLTAPAFSQNPPFWDDIQKFKHEDSISSPQKNAIVFTGSSSFTKWTDVQNRFPGYTIINRGFGGSTLPDVIRYADDVIFKYSPKQVVIYCGENDAASEKITADTVANRFITLFKMIRSRLPNTAVAFVSMKPSPSRAQFRQTVIAGNQKIRDFIAKQKNASYIDVYPKMLNRNGYPIGELFLSDSLHMTQKGYDVWQAAILPYLKK